MALEIEVELLRGDNIVINDQAWIEIACFIAIIEASMMVFANDGKSYQRHTLTILSLCFASSHNLGKLFISGFTILTFANPIPVKEDMLGKSYPLILNLR